jgi:hypothetical protein
MQESTSPFLPMSVTDMHGTFAIWYTIVSEPTQSLRAKTSKFPPCGVAGIL